MFGIVVGKLDGFPEVRCISLEEGGVSNFAFSNFFSHLISFFPSCNISFHLLFFNF